MSWAGRQHRAYGNEQGAREDCLGEAALSHGCWIGCVPKASCPNQSDSLDRPRSACACGWRGQESWTAGSGNDMPNTNLTTWPGKVIAGPPGRRYRSRGWSAPAASWRQGRDGMQPMGSTCLTALRETARSPWRCSTAYGRCSRSSLRSSAGALRCWRRGSVRSPDYACDKGP